MDCFDSISRIILCRTIEPNHYTGNGDDTGNSDGEEKAIGHVWNPDRDNLGTESSLYLIPSNLSPLFSLMASLGNFYFPYLLGP